jgi:hypothetical protein
MRDNMNYLKLSYCSFVTDKAMQLLEKLANQPVFSLVSEDNGYTFNYKGKKLFFAQLGKNMFFGLPEHSLMYRIPEAKRALFYKIIWVEETLDRLLAE